MQNMSVALLFQDFKVAKEISNIFRKTGIIPHLYETLEQYWSGTLTQTPSFAIIDVRMMSDGQKLLKNHPMVESEKIPLSFYYIS